MVDRIELQALEAADWIDRQIDNAVERRLLKLDLAPLYRLLAALTTAFRTLAQMVTALERKLAKAERTPLYKDRAALITIVFK